MNQSPGQAMGTSGSARAGIEDIGRQWRSGTQRPAVERFRARARQPPSAADRAPRFLYYCHDSFGLGHLRRTLKIAETLAGRWPDAAHLIVTGSPVADRFEVPHGIDYVKLPSVVKVGRERYTSRTLTLPFDTVRDLRAEVLRSAAVSFQPDVFLVDHAPAGLAGEAVPALLSLRRQSPAARLVVGLRDVIDDPDRVAEEWRRDGVPPLLDDVYDQILVYGHRDVYDLVSAYSLSAVAESKVRYVGYLGVTGARREPIDTRLTLGLDPTRPLVLFTGGGGGDAQPLLSAAVEGLRAGPPREAASVLVTGPLMAPGQRGNLAARAAAVPAARVVEFVDDMPSLMAAADAVVSMGGYNSVCEVLDAGRPTLVVPRSEPRREQLIRARALEALGLLRVLEPGALTPARLMAEVGSLLESTGPGVRRALGGLGQVADQVATLIEPRSVRRGVA